MSIIENSLNKPTPKARQENGAHNIMQTIKKLIETEPSLEATHHAPGESQLMNKKQTKGFIKQLKTLQSK